jgi:hypothetical protein
VRFLFYLSLLFQPRKLNTLDGAVKRKSDAKGPKKAPTAKRASIVKSEPASASAAALPVDSTSQGATPTTTGLTNGATDGVAAGVPPQVPPTAPEGEHTVAPTTTQPDLSQAAESATVETTTVGPPLESEIRPTTAPQDGEGSASQAVEGAQQQDAIEKRGA